MNEYASWHSSGINLDELLHGAPNRQEMINVNVQHELCRCSLLLNLKATFMETIDDAEDR